MLLASGAAIPISALKIGDKVLATNTRTGRVQPETVTAVMVNHDTDLYDLKIRAGNKTAVIHTTSNHPFWIPVARVNGGHWAEAGTLRYRTRLRIPGGGTVTVTGGWAPKVTTGWMWDITVPGNNDHDFYIDTTVAAILVHNCGGTFTARAGDLANPEKVSFSHPVNDAQLFGGEEVGHGGVANLSNEDLVRFGGPNGANRVNAGLMDPETLVEIAIGSP